MHNVVMLTLGRDSTERVAFDPARVIDLSPTAVSYWGRDMKCLYANRACRDWWGIDPEILLGCELEGVLEALRLDSHFELAEAALHGERRSLVQSFHEGTARCDGLVQYIPDMQGHLVRGLLIQVSPTPPTPRLERFRR